MNFIANINHYKLAVKFLPDSTIEVSADEASGLIRNGRLVGTPRGSARGGAVLIPVAVSNRPRVPLPRRSEVERT